MLKTKDELAHRLEIVCRRNLDNVKYLQDTMNKLKEIYNVPTDMASDIITFRTDLETQTDFVLFCIMDIIDNKNISEYFTQTEIDAYSKSRYSDSPSILPAVFNMVQVADDQWIGCITVKKLMELRDNQLIRYNANVQRSLQRIVNGNTEYYKIFLNKKAVSGIQQSFNKDIYIPNTITLNMPEDTEFSFSDGKLTIKSLSQFDILDGYHRYIAISNLYNLNPSFNYNMELRIVCFEDSKAKQFIWQEDQKTKMKKADSDSFNQTSEANKIVSKLNTDASFILYGLINRNDCIINSSELSLLINTLWFGNRNEKKEIRLQKSLQVYKELKDNLSYLVENNMELANTKWTFRYLAIVVDCIYEGITKENLYDVINRTMKECDENIIPSHMNKRMMTRIGKVVKK